MYRVLIDFFEVVSSEMDIRNFAVVEFDCVDKVVFRFSCDGSGVVELDVCDFACLSVEVLVGSEFFVEYEFDAVAFPVRFCNTGFTLRIFCRLFRGVCLW